MDHLMLFRSNRSLIRADKAARRWIAAVFFMLGVTGSPQALQARDSWRPPETDSVDRNLVDALLERSELDTAERLCHRMLAKAAKGSLEDARWAAMLAEVLTQRQVDQLFAESGSLQQRTETGVAVGTQPVRERLAADSGTGFNVLLRAAEIKSRQRILAAAIVAKTVSAANEQETDLLVKQFSRLQRDTDLLVKDIKQLWANAASGSGAQGDGFQPTAPQLKRLENQLRLSQLATAVLQTEVFDPQSDDYRSLATNAAVQAKQLLQQLPADAAAKPVASRWLAESELRSGNLFAAEQIASARNMGSNLREEQAWNALRVRLLLAKKDVAAAERLDQQLRSDAGTGGSSQVLDFSSLKVLLAQQPVDQDRVVKWIGTIGSRYGDFARRRAEAIVLRDMKDATLIAPAKSTMNASGALLVVQAEDWLRRGDVQQAGSLLQKAAEIEPDSAKALEYAGKAAAVWLRAEQPGKAAAVLSNLSQRHLSNPAASKTQLQAALIASKALSSQSADGITVATLIGYLQDVYQQWPQSEQAMTAVNWLVKIHNASGNNKLAGEELLQLAVLSKRPELIQTVAQQWFQAAMAGKATQADLVSLSQTLIELARNNDPLKRPVYEVAAWLFDLRSLESIVAICGANSAPPAESFAKQLANYRLQPNGSLNAETISAGLRQSVAMRVLLDGMTRPEIRKRNAALLGELSTENAWQSAVAEFWLQPNKATADALASETLRLPSGPLLEERLLQTKNILLGERSAEATQAAANLFERRSMGMQRGSVPWYQAKLAAIEVLNAQGQQAEAAKRAKYVLLTVPPKDEALQARLKQFAK